MKKVLILAGIKWENTYQRHQSIANYLAQKGYSIYFVEGIISSKCSVKKIVNRFLNRKTGISQKENAFNYRHKNITIISPRYLNPSKIFALYNNQQSRKILQQTGTKFDIVFNYLPILTTKFIWDQVESNMKIYDCVRAFENWGGYYADIMKIEEYFVLSCKCILVDSYYLVNKFQYQKEKVVQMLPLVGQQEYERYSHATIKKKIKNIVYFGSVDFHIDIALLNMLAERGYIIHIIGTINQSIRLHDSIVFHGFVKDLDELSEKISSIADAIIIPYQGNMSGVIPAKMLQSMATGLPVIINSFYDSEHLNDYLYVYHNLNNLMQLLEEYSYEDHIMKQKLMKEFALKNLDIHQYQKLWKIIENH